MSESREIYKTLDLALRMGEILLSSGAGAADVTATMLSVCQHYGVRNPDVDVTFTSLRMAHPGGEDEFPLMLTRTVTQRDIDYDDVTRVHELVLDILGDRITRDEARAKVARISSTGHWAPRWAVVLGSGAIGGGVAVILGGTLLVVAVAVVAGMGIDIMSRALNRRRWPMFYQQAAGGLYATMLAVGLAATPAEVDISAVITASIILLLAGIGFMGAVQDALSGFYVTAGARILEAMLATAGLIAGVSAGLALAPVIGVELGVVAPGNVLLANVPYVLGGAAVAAVAFAFTCYAPLKALPAVLVTTVLGHGIFMAIQAPGLGRPWAAAWAAIAIGLVSYTIAGRVGVPPLVVVVPSIVPMLPGLSIYRGLSAFADQDPVGIVFLTTAAATTIALASGVIAGEYLAQPLKRTTRKLETRLAGPRLVGVLHGHKDK
ncbi:MAG: threonine/serine exporter [Myxococcales bacterium]|nr:MAG: threonine/serine exporter [Myxococcales bacterium]